MVTHDPLVLHYIEVVVAIETMVLNQAPRMLRPRGLASRDVLALAELLAAGHEIHDQRKAQL